MSANLVSPTGLALSPRNPVAEGQGDWGANTVPGHGARSLGRPTVGPLLRYIEPVSSSASCESILQRFLSSRDIYSLPVVDQYARPLCLLDRTEYVEFFSKIYANEVFGREKIVTLLEHQNFTCKETIVLEDSCLMEDGAQIIIDRGTQHLLTGLIVARAGRYIGIVNGHDLLKAIAHRRQDELMAFNEELEAQVAVRTSQLEAANRDFESFSYTIAHDLRAPVRAISSFSELVLLKAAGTLDQGSVGYLRRVIVNSRRMGAMVDDLLHLFGLSRHQMRWEAIDLTALAGEIVEFLARATPERSVAVTIHAGLRATGDVGLIRSMLENVIGNAWKYTQKSAAAAIEVGVRQVGNEPTYFVRDNGAGFDMQYADKLFKPFQRLHLDSEFEGTGIGLATVRKIIERHNGAVSIESAVNAGTTVHFTIGRPE